jgi:hypothetical protein
VLLDAACSAAAPGHRVHVPWPRATRQAARSALCSEARRGATRRDEARRGADENLFIPGGGR